MVCALRKSSSLVHIALLMAGGVPIDLFLEARYRSQGIETRGCTARTGCWARCTPAADRHRLVRRRVDLRADRPLDRPHSGSRRVPQEPEAVADLFPDEWSLEQVEKPRHDAAYYILRLIGLAYLSYFVLAIVGLLGTAPWPAAIRDLLDMTYANPALTINTFIKLTIIFVLATLGAHNIKLRWHCSLILLVGHLVSTAASLFFYHCTPRVPGNDFLLTSAIVDG